MRPSRLVIGLIVSVALNLFLIGAGVGVVALGVHMARQNQAARAGALARATRDLPQPDRRNMRMALRADWIAVKPAVEQSRALRLAAWGAIADPKPDVAAIKQQLAQSRALDLANRATVEEKVVDYALTLPPADRKIFADGMRRVLTPPPAPPPKVQQPATNTP